MAFSTGTMRIQCKELKVREMKVEDSENEKINYLIEEYESEKKYKRTKILGIVLSLLTLGAVAGYYLINSSTKTTTHPPISTTSPITEPQTAKIIDITKTFIPTTQPNTIPTTCPTQTKPTPSTNITTTLPTTTHPPTTTSPTSKIPEIESLEYKERVKKESFKKLN